MNVKKGTKNIMTDLMQKAINHIDDEAEKSKNPMTKRIAQYLIDKCITNDINAQKLLDSNKSISKCVSDVTAKAKKEAVSGCAVIEDEVVFGWVREYYDITDICELQSTATPFSGPSLLDLL